MKRFKKALLQPVQSLRMDVDEEGAVVPVSFCFGGETYRVRPGGAAVDDRLSILHCDLELTTGEAVHMRIEKGPWSGELHTVTTPWPDRWRGRLEPVAPRPQKS